MKASQLLPGEFHIPDEVYSQYTDEQKKEIEAWRTRYFSDDPDMVSLRGLDRQVRKTEVDRKQGHVYVDKRNGKEYTRPCLEMSYERFCEEGGTELASDFNLESWFERKAAGEVLQNALASLSEDERRMLLDYYLNGYSQLQISKKYSISQQMVSYRLNAILKKIRNFF